MKENIEVDITLLNEKQLHALLILGEIDAITYYECVEQLEIKRSQGLFYKIRDFKLNMRKVLGEWILLLKK